MISSVSRHALLGLCVGLALSTSACIDGSMSARELDDTTTPDGATPGGEGPGGEGPGGEGPGGEGPGGEGPGGEGPGGEGPGGEGPGGEMAGIVPGRVTISRLNRAEYNNTVRDLLFTEQRPADAFPADDFGYGFNNIGDTLTVSPLHVELYEKSADALIEEALAPAIASSKEFFEAEVVTGSLGAASGEFWNLWSNGELVQQVELPLEGRYIIRARVGGQQAGPDLTRMAFIVNGFSVQDIDVPATREAPAVYEFETTLDAGRQSFGVGFLNDFRDTDTGADRNLYVDWIEIEGPIGATGESTPARERIMVCDETTIDCAHEIFAAFGRRAWRRPLTDAEIERLGQFIGVAASNELTFEDGLRLGIKALLLSPHFIFRPEMDQTDVGVPHALTAHELASRLSYFLWSSTPDDTLQELADSGELLNDDVLRAQIERMLSNERAVALIDNFVTQWLYTDAVLEADPDYVLFPDYNEDLARDMRTESRMFASDFILEDRDYRELLTADYSYINARLAEHYDIPGITGDELRRHTFTGEQRRGILTQGGLLTARSYPNRTSPVLRGVWVLEEILCSEPPPPPADVESIDDQMAGEDLTLRERLELHVSEPSCQACHKIMDPIGFGMEHYGPTGQWRDNDNGRPVDALGELPDGRTFLGAHAMADVLAEDPLYSECLAEKMLVYATGRGMDVRLPGSTIADGEDAPQVQHIADALVEKNYSSRELIIQVVLSDAFRQRTPEPRQ